jgi:hypothetical protein
MGHGIKSSLDLPFEGGPSLGFIAPQLKSSLDVCYRVQMNGWNRLSVCYFSLSILAVSQCFFFFFFKGYIGFKDYTDARECW